MTVTRSDLAIHRHFAPTRDGWALELRRAISPRRFDRDKSPILMVPGYGMNTFVLGYHPYGTSMERCLAEDGYEVWSVNMRGQGGARRRLAEAPDPSIRSYVEVDLTTAIDAVLRQTRARRDRVSLIGCSLGGSIAYALLALQGAGRIGALVTMGAPLRWDETHPVLRALLTSPWLAGKVRMYGTRRVARAVLPVALRLPYAVDLYMNRTHFYRAAASEMVKTVDDLFPRVNREIAHWIRQKDLVVRGVNVTEAMQQQTIPLLVVVANRDGIVPPATAVPAAELWGGPDAQVLRVGTDSDWYAHADLFISKDSPDLVFNPIGRWLDARP